MLVQLRISRPSTLADQAERERFGDVSSSRAIVKVRYHHVVYKIICFGVLIVIVSNNNVIVPFVLLIIFC